MDKKWSRRIFIESTLAGAGVVALSTWPNLACQPPEAASRVLSALHRKTLLAAIDEIIPAAVGMPAASEVGSLEYLVQFFVEDPDVLDVFKQGLDRLQGLSRERHGGAFAALSPDERVGVMQNLEEVEPAFLSILRDYTYEAYYTRPQVWELLEYEPYPTMAAGPTMAPFEERLLERVRQMPKLYREAE